MAGLRDVDLPALGADVAALSVDPPAASAPLARQLNLSFPILCDTERRVIDEWHLHNRRENGGIAYPAVFVIDQERRVRYRSLERTAARADPTALADFLRGGMQGPSEAKPRRVIPSFGDFIRALGNALRRGVKSPRRS